MKLERSDVDFPLWRKKVDFSLFEQKGTSIPAWACKMWEIPSIFGKCSSKKTDDSEVTILFGKKRYKGYVTVLTKSRKTPYYRLWYEEDLSIELKHKFLMSYMRSLEKQLRAESKEEIEKEIPFWEFLDIEFDGAKRLFKFKAYYYQEPSFPELFAALFSSLERLTSNPRFKSLFGVSLV